MIGLKFDVFGGVFLAFFTDFGLGHGFGLVAQFGHNFDLDGQAVAVPAGDVGRLKAAHGFIFDDKVLEDLVDNVAHVDIAVGIGRAVVKNVHRGAAAGGLDFGIDSVFVPGFTLLGFALSEIGLHRKAGLRQVQGIPVTLFFFLCIRHNSSF